MKVLLTGASGGLGAELAATLSHAGHSVVCAMHKQTHMVRNNGEILSWNGRSLDGIGPGERMAVPADVTAENLGLASSTHDWLSRSVDIVIHAAAVTDFGQQDWLYETINIAGTRNMVSFVASAPRPIPLIHISTAYVSGYWDGQFGENDFDGGQEFGNAYEWSKFEAERVVRAAIGTGLRAVIVRPSIIVGTTRTGQIRDFRHFYPVLRVIGEGRVRSVAGQYDACIDMIPIDFVVSGVAAILERAPECLGQTFHLVSGEPITMREVSDVLAEFPSMHAPRLIPPTSFDPERLSSREKAYYKRLVSLFQAYFLRTVEFDRARFDGLFKSPRLPDRRVLLRRLISYGQKVGYFGAAQSEAVHG